MKNKKFIIMPDSFKGTMTSMEICSIMKKSLLLHFPTAKIISLPVADGGEGTVDAFITANGGQKIDLNVTGPYFKKIPAFYGILPDNTAIIEMAAAAGLPLVGNKRHAEQTTTFGVGELIKDAIDNYNCQKIIIGLGGSCTNDGGCGMAAALGAVFTDTVGQQFIPIGKTLHNIASIDISAIKENYSGVCFSAMCDINNELCGSNGAAAVFAPQKGADAATVDLLDNGLYHFAAILKTQLQKDTLHLKGAGAAGGMGAGIFAFLNCDLKSGIDIILNTVNFDNICEDSDIIFTGEGKIDQQSIQGKVISGIAQRAKKHAIPVIAVVGSIDNDIDAVYDLGVTAIFSINRQPLSFSKSAPHSKNNLYLTMDNIVRLIKLFPNKNIN
ncbi:glycerate kinase [Pectinatus brassicae]|uniref:Glycerate kinase n=1 Tax=Pectinatus brassicae TaxID=862415 RepID=A0A840UQW8_9FIRM|nr:glycerate kinase [Pectinatus brassicae]MBB5335393.1 glycerate kinase [Pectinatus brassicae]